MKKIISIVLSVLMLSAMVIPAMAEGEVTIKKLNYGLNEGTFDGDSYTCASTVQPEVVSENGNAILKLSNLDVSKTYGVMMGENNSSKAITDTTYEAGFKIKLTNPGADGLAFNAQLLGESSNNPLLNHINFKSYGKHNNDYRMLRSTSSLIADRDTGLITGEWNDIRFLINESTTEDKLTYKVYVNGVKRYEYVLAVNGLNGTNANKRNPYKWALYYSDKIEAPIYLDDVYVASYTDVTTFVPETVSVNAGIGETVTLPSTVNVAVNGVTEAVSVEWADVDITTPGTKTVTGVVKGYTMSDASDVTVTATVTVAEPKYAYNLAIEGNTLTVTKAGTLTPEAKVYGAVYEGGILKDVQLLGTVSASTDWSNGNTTFNLDEGKSYRAFVINNQLVPFAISTELN